MVMVPVNSNRFCLHPAFASADGRPEMVWSQDEEVDLSLKILKMRRGAVVLKVAIM